MANTDNQIMPVSLGTLKGSIRVPQAASLRAFTLVIAGSGATDRDGNSSLGRNNSLKYLAEGLSEFGIASLCYDKRLVGESLQKNEVESDVVFENYIDDAVNWLKYIDQRYEVPIFVIGHSEGSLIGALAIQQFPCTGFISIAGTSRHMSKLILEQVKGKCSQKLYDELKQGLRMVSAGQTVSASKELDTFLRKSLQPYIRSQNKYSPTHEFSKLPENESGSVSASVLVIHGTKDIQVPVSDAKELHAACPNSKLIIVEKMNHVLKEIDGDLEENLNSYIDDTIPVHSQLTRKVSEFILGIV